MSHSWRCDKREVRGGRWAEYLEGQGGRQGYRNMQEATRECEGGEKEIGRRWAGGGGKTKSARNGGIPWLSAICGRDYTDKSS